MVRLKFGNTLKGILVLLLFVPASCMFAQVTATLNGRAADPTGAAVPGARVVVTNEATGAVVRTMVTNAQGYYSAPNLSGGRYSVKADASGFKTFERTGIVLDVASTVEADIAFAVGGGAQSVTVQADQVQVQTETNDVSTVISQTQIDEIDVNGRDPFQLAALTAGASNAAAEFLSPVGSNATPQIVFNGLRKQWNDYFIDGAEVTDRGGGGGYAIEPSQNAIAEFKVIAADAPGNIGLAAGGLASVELKSGTHDLHASAWEYVRNQAFDANNYLAKQNGTQKPELRYNLFGFNVGGPVVIPHLYGAHRDKTFFFYNMEWRRLVQGNQILPLAIPASVQGGNFGSTAIFVPSTTDPAAIARFAMYGLTPGKQFPNNTIPAGLIDPNVQLLLKEGVFPTPNSADGLHFSSATPARTNLSEEVARIDHKINDKLALTGSLIWDGGYEQNIPGTSSVNSYSNNGSFFTVPSYVTAVRLIHVITSNLLNQVGFNYDGNRQQYSPFGLYQLPAGYTAQSYYPAANELNRIPTITIGTPYSVNFDVGPQEPYHNAYNFWEYRDDLSWLHGKHSMMFGGSVILDHKVQTISGYTQGNYGFSGAFTKNSVADFLLGYAASFSELALQDTVNIKGRTYTAYAEDSWKLTDRLTLNYGLRFESLPHIFEADKRLSNFVPSAYNPSLAPQFTSSGSLNSAGPGFSEVNGVYEAIPNTPFYLNGVVLAGSNGTPQSLTTDGKANFAPRIGFSYALSGDQKTVLRGGFGMFYNRTQMNDSIRMGTNAPFSYTPTASNVYFSNPSTSNTNGATATIPTFPAAFTALDPHNPIPTAMDYNLGIQRQLSSIAVLSLAYVGTHTYHESYDRDINAVPLSDPNRLAICGSTCGYKGTTYNANLDRNYPGFSHISLETTGTTSNYDSLQAQATIRITGNLNVTGAYTYSHGLDSGSADLGALSNPYNKDYDRGNADFDRRHIAQFSYYYRLPFFLHGNLLERETIAGWQISGVTTAETGQPQSVTATDVTGLGGTETDRANQIAPVVYTKTAAHWVSYSSFAAPAPLTFGNSARNLVYGPGQFNWNIALFKSFPVGHRAQFEFRGETFNTFNHTEFSTISTSYSSGAASFGKVTGVFDPREIQLGGTLSF